VFRLPNGSAIGSEADLQSHLVTGHSVHGLGRPDAVGPPLAPVVRRVRSQCPWRTISRGRMVCCPGQREDVRGRRKGVALVPTANEISVREVLAKFEAEFASVANAVENGEFALWLGSGISQQAPNLGNLIERAFDYIRERAVDPATAGAYLPALEEALALAEIDSTNVRMHYAQRLAAWPEYPAIINRLWTKYSRVLDIRIAGTDPDFVLWTAIDIRQAFENPGPPAAEHLCIAILILEGAIQAIASANWDGFIEAAVERLSNGVPNVMQVVVDPNQLRGPAGRARLLKFHGCIV
jgi:hypothetical protein